MPEESDLVGKVVMIVGQDIRLGTLQSLKPMVMSGPYLIITGGSTKNPNLELSKPEPITGLCEPELYRSDSLAQKLEKNFCFSPDEAKSIVRMADGLYRI